MVHAWDNIEDFITKRSSAGADGAGINSTEKKEVEKKICDNKEEERAAGAFGAGKNPSLEKIQCLEKVKCAPNL